MTEPQVNMNTYYSLPEIRIDTSLIRTIILVQRVSVLERFHCILLSLRLIYTVKDAMQSCAWSCSSTWGLSEGSTFNATTLCNVL